MTEDLCCTCQSKTPPTARRPSIVPKQRRARMVAVRGRLWPRRHRCASAPLDTWSLAIYIYVYTDVDYEKTARSGKFSAAEAALVSRPALARGPGAARLRHHAGGAPAHGRQSTAVARDAL